MNRGSWLRRGAWANGRALSFSPLRLGDALDLTSNLNGGTITEDASGNLVFGIPGGAATPDIAGGVTGLWRARDVDRAPATLAAAQFIRTVIALMVESGTPDLNGDSGVGVALINSTNLATCNGIRWAMQYSGGARQVSCSRILAGVSTTGTTGNVSLDRAFGTASQPASGLWYGSTEPYVANWIARSASGATQNAQPKLSPGDLYWAVTGFRTAATAGLVTLGIAPEAPPTTGITPLS